MTPSETVRTRLEGGGYPPAGNCHEAALAVGILLAKDPDVSVRLVSGMVRGVRHWWVVADGQIVDPTADQFSPPPSPGEYVRLYFDGIDLQEMAWLLTPRE